MVDNTQWLADAKARLAVSQGSRRRTGSIAAKVEALRPEIEAARAAGKTWKQIALDISDDGEELNEDAVRVAFNRIKKAQGVPAAPAADGSTKRAAARKPTDTPNAVDTSPPIATSEASEVSESEDKPTESSQPADGVFADMFAPLLDARDTRGRGSDRASIEEHRS